MKTFRFVVLGYATLIAGLAGCDPGAVGADGLEGDVLSDGRAGSSQLAGENLGGVNLGAVNLGAPNLGAVNLGAPNLGGVNLGGVNLGAVNLGGTNLGGPNLGGVNLGATNLGAVNLGGVNLGGVNLGGVNLGATNLGGVNLGAPNLGGVNLGATNLGGVNLGATNAGINIHGQPATGMLYSGEDTWSTASSRCVVLGLGSTAFARLVAQNTGTRMYAAIKQLPWGFAETAGGPTVSNAWEAVVWGNARYCTFVLVVPPGATHAGVAGFIKAVFRWSAPPTKSIDIGQIGGGQPIQTHGGMMNVGARVLNNTVTEKAYMAGELAFVTATTNNESVQVDFASWVRQSNNAGLILGNVSGAPIFSDAVYVALENADGTIELVLRDLTHPVVPNSINLILSKTMDMSSGMPATNPIPDVKRCSGAQYLATLAQSSRLAIPDLRPFKCDTSLTVAPGGSAASWTGITWAAAGATVMPYNGNMRMESPVAKAAPSYTFSFAGTAASYFGGFIPAQPAIPARMVISETYVHLNQYPYANSAWTPKSGIACADVSAGEVGSFWCVTPQGSLYSVFQSYAPSLMQNSSGVRVSGDGNGYAWLVNGANEVFQCTNYSPHTFANPCWKVSGACRDIASIKSVPAFSSAYCIGSALPDGQVQKWNGAAWSAVGTLTANRIAVDTDGTPYAAKSNGAVYRYANAQWTQVATGCVDIGVGAGFLYCTDSSKQVRRWNRVSSAWEVVAGRTADAVSVDPYGRPWAADGNGVWTWY